MKEFLQKLTSYNIFNFLVPGIVFVVLTREATSFSFVQDDLLTGLFLYYFIGMVISRFGSLFIEPLLKGVRFVKFAEYKDFVVASQKDEKLDTLSEVNNTYRTITSMFVLILLLKLWGLLTGWLPDLKSWNAIFLITVLLFMFLFSYRKQTKYITKRIRANL